jgi:hypothetical protein
VVPREPLQHLGRRQPVLEQLRRSTMASAASLSPISVASSVTLPEPNSVAGRGCGSGTISSATTSSCMARANPALSASRSSGECTMAARPALPLPAAARWNGRTGTSTTARTLAGRRSSKARRPRSGLGVDASSVEMAIPVDPRRGRSPSDARAGPA